MGKALLLREQGLRETEVVAARPDGLCPHQRKGGLETSNVLQFHAIFLTADIGWH